MQPMDHMLWQSCTNLLSIITTQLKYLADVGQVDAAAREMCLDRTRTLKEIADKLHAQADAIEARVQGTVDDDEMDKLFDDLNHYLGSIEDDDSP